MKMNLMPRLLYHFQALLIKVPSSFLKAVNQALVNFLWTLKPPRLAQSTLRLPKLRGGMAFSDGNLYHVACHLTRVLDWCRHGELKQWVKVECALLGLPLESLPWCQMDLPQQAMDHPTIGETKDKLEGFPGLLDSAPAIATPTHSRESTFYPWTPRLQFFGFENNRVVTGSKFHLRWTLDDETTNYGLSGLSFWQKIQLSHFLRSLPPLALFQRSLTIFEQLCLEQSTLSHVSLTYQLLTSPPAEYKPPYITGWERELGLELTEKQVDRLYLFS